MKFTADRNELRAALESCLKVVDKKPQMPLLTHVRVEVKGALLTLTATNLREEVTTSIAVRKGTDGATCLKASELATRVSAMPEGDVLASAKDDKVEIKSAARKRKFVLSCLPAEDFPAVQKPSGTKVQIAANLIARMVRDIRSSVNPEVSAGTTHNALLDFSATTALMAGTDARRLSISAVKHECAEPVSAKIPLSGVIALQDVAEKSGDAKATVTINDARVFFKAGRTLLTITQGENDFPPYRNVIPKTQPTKLEVPRSELLESVKSLMVATNANGTLAMAVDGEQLVLSCPDGSGEDVLSVTAKKSGAAVKLGLNGAYLADALSMLESDDVTISLGDELDPVIVKPKKKGEYAERLALVMPIRI